MSPSPKLNLLVAFPYWGPRFEAVCRELGDDMCLLIDSGAFTAWKNGETIKLDDYCDFLEKLPVKPWHYLTLDVVGDPDATRRNYEEMLRRGFNPVPIHTRGETLEVFDQYAATADLVGLGGLVGGGEAARRHVKAVHQHANGKPLHLLGFTSFGWLKYLRPLSADSSNWESGGRYGRASVYAGCGRFNHYMKADAEAGPPSPEICAAVRAIGFDPYRLMRRENWHGTHGMARWVSGISWIKASMDFELNLGTKLFVSASAAGTETILRDGYLGLTGKLDVEPAQIAHAKAIQQRRLAA